MQSEIAEKGWHDLSTDAGARTQHDIEATLLQAELLRLIAGSLDRETLLGRLVAWFEEQLQSGEVTILDVAQNGRAFALDATFHDHRTTILATADETIVRGEGLSICEQVPRQPASRVAQSLSSKLGKPIHTFRLSAGSTCKAVVLVVGEVRPALLSHRNVIESTIGEQLEFVDGLPPRDFLHWLTHQLRGLRLKLSRTRTRTWFMITAAVIVFLMLPVHETWTTSGRLVPAKQRFVTASVPGMLTEVLSRPGELVRKGDTIARIDSPQAESKLDEASAKLKEAVQRHNQAIVAGDGLKIHAAEIERQRWSDAVALREKQMAQTNVNSPVDGMVIDGIWEASQDRPVAVGETLFEIAALERLHLEIDISQYDYQAASVGMWATAELIADSRELTCKIERISPIAKLRDDESVFVATTTIVNPNTRLRPGMRASVTLYGEKRPLFMVLYGKLAKQYRKWRLP